MAHDVFISYSSKDKTIADAVCAGLEAKKIRCWIAPRDVLPGLPFAEALIDGLSGSTVVVLIFSANSNNSPHVTREVERAVNKGITIIPFRIEDVIPTKAMEYFVSSAHWLDALTPPLENHVQKLATTVELLLGMRGPRVLPDASAAQADELDLATSEAIKAEKFKIEVMRDREKLANDVDKLTRQVNSIKREISKIKSDISEKWKEAGELAYPILSVQDILPGVQSVVDGAKRIDKEIDRLSKEKNELQTFVPQGGFLSKLKDKTIARGKALKLGFDIGGLQKDKDRLLQDLGRELSVCHEQGANTPDILLPVWQSVGTLKGQLEIREKDLVLSNVALKKLQEQLNALENQN